MTLTLSEAYDRNLKKIINKENPNYNMRGIIELSEGKITHVFASVNDFELNPTSLTRGVNGGYIYGTESGEGGMAQANFINSNEFNLYFVSGPYHGYTLIFSRELSDDELYEKENLRVKFQNQQILSTDDGTVENHILNEEAVVQRIKFAVETENLQVKRPSNSFSGEDEERINVLLKASQNGEVLPHEERAFIKKHSREIKDQGGFNFSAPF